MAMNAEELHREVMALPHRARADLAADLLASLDESSEDEQAVKAAWDEEMIRRATAVEAGESDPEEWESLRDRLLDELRN